MQVTQIDTFPGSMLYVREREGAQAVVVVGSAADAAFIAADPRHERRPDAWHDVPGAHVLGLWLDMAGEDRTILADAVSERATTAEWLTSIILPYREVGLFADGALRIVREWGQDTRETWNVRTAQ